jgi:hypothetical protein
MKLNNRVIQSLFAILSVTVIFLGTAIAEEYNGSVPSENLAMKSPSISASLSSASATLAQPISPSSYCFKCLPSPRLAYKGKEDYTVSGVAYTRYNLEVANRDDYPASLFKPAPDLPPCGLNTNSARTWVSINNSNGNYIYGFCALSSPSDLNGLWFAIPKGKTPPKSVYITLNDRRCKIVLKSNLVTIS